MKYNLSRNTIYYVIAFLEGGAVMACELIAGKMIAPYYGNSLYVWTSVVGSTLGGLAAGYYFGGKLSTKGFGNKILAMVLLLSALLFALMPQLSSFIMQATLNLSVQMGSLISCLIFIFPLLLCFGIVSPLIIRLVSIHDKEAGKKAANVYAISTAGGVILTFAMGFYFIPFFGLKMSAYVSATLLGVVALLSLMNRPVTQDNSFLVSDH